MTLPLVPEKWRIIGLLGQGLKLLRYPFFPRINSGLYLGRCLLEFGRFERWSCHGPRDAHEILAEVVCRSRIVRRDADGSKAPGHNSSTSRTLPPSPPPE